MKFRLVELTRVRGIAQIPLIVGLLLMAIAIPVATRLSQQEQDTRDMAAVAPSCSGVSAGSSCCTDCTAACCNNQMFACAGGTWTMVQSCSAGCKTDRSGCNASCAYSFTNCKACGDGCAANEKSCYVTNNDCTKAWKCLNFSSQCVVNPTTPPSVDCGSHPNHSNWCEGDRRAYCSNGTVYYETCSYGCNVGSGNCNSPPASTATPICSPNSLRCREELNGGKGAQERCNPLGTGWDVIMNCVTGCNGNLCDTYVTNTPIPVKKYRCTMTNICVEDPYGNFSGLAACENMCFATSPVPTAIPTVINGGGSTCSNNTQCPSGDCVLLLGKCRPIPDGGLCITSADCASLRCNVGVCMPKVSGGQDCILDTACQSGTCVTSLHMCRPIPDGETCIVNEDCGAASSCVGIVDRKCVKKGNCTWAGLEIINGQSKCFNALGGVGSQMIKCTDGSPSIVNTYSTSNCVEKGECMDLTGKEDGCLCALDTQCSSGNCVMTGIIKTCQKTGPGGSSCVWNSQCTSNNCILSLQRCRPIPDGETCIVNEDCGAASSCVGIVDRKCVKKGNCTWAGLEIINGQSKCFNALGGVGSQMIKCTDGDVSIVGTYVGADCSEKGDGGEFCLTGLQCKSGVCVQTVQKCRPIPNGEACVVDGDCASNRCVAVLLGRRCMAKVAGGGECYLNSDCESDNCVILSGILDGKTKGQCRPLPDGYSCIVGADCASHVCANFKCVGGSSPSPTAGSCGGQGQVCCITDPKCDRFTLNCVSNKCCVIDGQNVTNGANCCNKSVLIYENGANKLYQCYSGIVPTPVPNCGNVGQSCCSGSVCNYDNTSCINNKCCIQTGHRADNPTLCCSGMIDNLGNCKENYLTPTAKPTIPYTPGATSIPNITPQPTTQVTPVPTSPNAPPPGPTSPPGPPPVGCSYTSLQARVQENSTVDWQTQLTIQKGEKVNLGCMYNGSGQLANNVKIVVGIGNETTEFTDNLVEQWEAPKTGNYTIWCVSTDSNCGNLPSNSNTTLSVGSACKECPNDFHCYGPTTANAIAGWNYAWFATGYVMEGYETQVPDNFCPDYGGIPRPRWLGKVMGDANCDGQINTYDFTMWNTEFEVSEGGEVVSENWETDFTGPQGVCDGLINTYDFSLWNRSYVQLEGGDN